jgi:hypothetical protein
MITIKNAVLRVLLISMISTSFLSVYAGGILRVKPTDEGGKAIVRVANFDAKNLTLSIEDENQKVVFYKESMGSDADFAKVFDVSSLKDGRYVFIVNAGKETLTQKVEIVDSKLTVQDSKKLKEPFFKIKDDILLIYFHNDSEDFTKVNFYDYSENFFTDELTGSVGVKKYSLTELPAGDYVVSVTGAGGSFKHAFTK